MKTEDKLIFDGKQSMDDKSKILVVDDTPVSLALMTEILTSAGYQVRAFGNAESALTAVDTDQPDLILLDVSMPGMNGFEACSRLKSQENTQDIPIIFISAFSELKERVKGLQLGAVDYIAKPFQSEELLARVKTHLTLRQANNIIEQQVITLNQTNNQLRAEIVKRRIVEDELHKNFDHTERSRKAMLSMLEDQKEIEEKLRSQQAELAMQNDELRQIQEKLQASQERYSNLYNLAPTGYITINEKGLILESNLTASSILSTERDSLLNQPFHSFILPEDQDIYYLYLKKLLKTRMWQTCELRLKSKGDTRLWARLEAILSCSTDNNISFFTAIIDITQLKETEEILRASEERFRVIATTAQDAFIMMDSKGCISFWNQAAEKIFGYPKEEALGKNLHDFLAPVRFHGAYMKAFPEFLKTGAGNAIGKTLELAAIRKNGEEFPIELSLSSVFLNNSWNAVGILRDITERKIQQDIIKEKNSFLTNILNSISSPLYIIDAEDYTVKLANIAAGCDDLKDNITCYKMTHRRDTPCSGEHICPLQEVKRTKSKVTTEHIHFDKDGNERIVEVHGYPIFNEKGDVIQIVEHCLDITERIKMTKELKESEKRFRVMFENAGVGVALLVSRTGRFIKVNRKYSDFVGYTIEEMEKLSFQDITHPEDIQVNREFIDLLLTGKNTEYTMEKRYIHKNGSIVWGRLTISPLWLPGEPPQYHVAIVEDITQRKKAEADLVNAAEEWEKTFNSITDFIFVQDSNHNIVKANKAFADLLKLPIAEIIGKKCYDLLHKTKAPLFVCQFEEVKKSKKPSTIEMEEKKLGLFLQITISPVFDENGNYLASVHYIKDITERKKSEELLRIRTALLEYSFNHTVEEFLQKTLDEIDRFMDSPIGFYHFVDPDQKNLTLMAWSTRTQKEFCNAEGKFSHYSIDKAGVWVDCVHQRKAVIHNDYESLTHKKGMPKGHAKVVRELVVPIMRENLIVAILGIGNKSTDYTPKDVEIVTYLADVAWEIAARKRVEEEIIKHRDHLEELVKERTAELEISRNQAQEATIAKSMFLANMSHEIRTPMNAVIGFSDLLYPTLKEEKQRSQLNAIRNSGKNLLTIINDILDLSKIEAGKMRIQYEPVLISRMLKGIENIFTERAKEKGISFIVKMDEDIPEMLIIDEVRIRQVLFNIIGNAIKFTDKGSVTLTVHKESKENGKIELIFAVEDTGIGIAEDQQQLIFQTFNQQERQKAAKYGGTGLGLAISKRLTEMMGGTISVKSSPGKGSVFAIHLADVAIADSSLSLKEESFFDLDSVYFTKGTVLIADDNSLDRKLVSELLENSPIKVIEASNGVEAIEMAVKYQPDVIFMDLRMPGMDGSKAAKIIKESETTKYIPVIALTASALTDTDAKASSEIFDYFLIKPILLSNLIELLEKYLPYQIKDKEVVSEKDKDDLPLIEHFETEIKISPELINILENKFLPIFDDISKKQVIDQIDKFGRDLLSLGKNMSCGILSEFAQKLCIYAGNFEIDKLLKTLKTFPDIVNRIKEMETLRNKGEEL